MGKSEHDMEIRSVDHFRPPFIHPDLLIDTLAAGAVSVAAGVVMDLHMATVCTAADVIAKGTGLTVEDRMGNFLLDIRLKGTGCTESFVGMFPDLLDGMLSHCRTLSGQRG